MTYGITAEISELIALRQYARAVSYRPEQRAARPGNHLSKRRGRGMDFAEVRHYQVGDEIRHMEWRITARMGKPHIKIYQEERERPVVLLADFNPSMYFGSRQAFKSVIAARLAAMLAWTAIKQGDWVGGLFFSATEHNEYSPRAREEGVLTLIKALSEYTSKNPIAVPQPRSMANALRRLNRVARPGSILVLISDFYQFDNECEQLLARLRDHNDVLAYHVCDPLELAPPIPQQYVMTNGREELVLDTTDRKINQAYQQICETRIATLKQQFKRLHIQYVQVTPMEDIARLVYDTFPRRSYG
jgi:uncharacterized protein (DUF58 family)